MQKNKILFVSLGCDKNLVDTEVMLGILSQRGYEFTDDEEQADAVVINTCCFINDAKEESVNTILSMAERRKSGQLKALLVAGCLAQRYADEIQEEIPEVDAILGTTAIDAVADALDEVLKGSTGKYIEDINKLPEGGRHRVVTTGGHYAYLKIAEGCNKHCTYCIIPKVRGDYRSVPMEQLLKEAGELVAGGVKELILVAQETTLYGKDLYGEKSLHKLLEALCQIEGIHWIRLLYCYPEEITPELIDTIKREKKICHYLDIPVQSGCDEILKRMGRFTNTDQIRQMVQRLRKEIPDICIRTTLISGFPGETKEQHEDTMYFVNEMEFNRLGVFTYSPEEDTSAAAMEGQIPEDVKCERRDEIMELQQEIAFEQAEAMVGQTVEAIIEGSMPEDGVYVARTYRDAPEVDGFLFLQSQRELMSGDFVMVKITGSNEYDLIGEIIS